MEDENEEAVIRIIERKLNIGQYKHVLYDHHFLNSNKLLSTPISVLAYQTGVPIDVCEKVVSTVAKTVVPSVEFVELEMPRPRFGDLILDNSIIIPESGIVEVSGQAGAGKSNLVYHLAVHERMHDMSRNVVIISTEGKVPINRIRQIAECTNSQFDADDIINGIMITEVESVKSLSDVVQTQLPNLFFAEDTPPPSLVIIDSIAALFRLEYDISGTNEKTRILFDITGTLKWISGTHKTLIVVTNQATANLTAFATNVNDWIPSLGFSWSNCINVRLKLNKTHMKHQIPPGNRVPVTTASNGNQNFPTTIPIRTIYVEISPIKQDIKVEMYIDNSGVHGI